MPPDKHRLISVEHRPATWPVILIDKGISIVSRPLLCYGAIKGLNQFGRCKTFSKSYVSRGRGCANVSEHDPRLQLTEPSVIWFATQLTKDIYLPLLRWPEP